MWARVISRRLSMCTCCGRMPPSVHSAPRLQRPHQLISQHYIAKPVQPLQIRTLRGGPVMMGRRSEKVLASWARPCGQCIAIAVKAPESVEGLLSWSRSPAALAAEMSEMCPISLADCWAQGMPVQLMKQQHGGDDVMLIRTPRHHPIDTVVVACRVGQTSRRPSETPCLC